MRGHGEKLSRKQERAIAALLLEPTISAAAAVAEVNERTLRVWMKIPAFRDAYQEARREVLNAAIVKLQRSAIKAVNRLERNLNCKDPGPANRAAVAILRYAIQGTHLADLDERMREIENGLASGQAKTLRLSQ